MGNVDYVELMGVLAALETVLKKGGHDFETGSGMKAAMESVLSFKTL